MKIKTYNEFRNDWFHTLNTTTTDDGVEVGQELLEWFCACDYKRYTGEWGETL